MAETPLLDGPRQGWAGALLGRCAKLPYLGKIIGHIQRKRRKRFRASLPNRQDLRARIRNRESGREFQQALSRRLASPPPAVTLPPLAGAPRNPDVRCSVIINTVDRAGDLAVTLTDLGRQWRADLDELLIVVGPTSDDTRGSIARSGIPCRVIDCPVRNLAVSRNLGLEAAAGEFVAFLDDDASPCEGWLDALLAPLSRRPSPGASAGFAMDGEGRRFLTRYVVSDRLGWSTWWDQEDQARRHIAREGAGRAYPTATGCNMAFRRDLILSLGGFDPFYSYYLEETDLILRLHDTGYPCAVAPQSVVLHRLGASPARAHDAEMSGRRVILRSQLHFARKFGKGFHGNEEIEAGIWRRILADLELIAWKDPANAASLQARYLRGVIDDLKIR